MNTLKQICKKNWYIIVATLLLFICSEVLCGIMVYDRQYFNPEPFSFYGGIIVLRVVSLLAGVFITYFLLIF